MTFAERWITRCFPALLNDSYVVTSHDTPEYNCIAWAAGDTDSWWWPHPDSYWPAGAPVEETLTAFIQAFQTRGYESCEDGAAEAGFVKIAIYADARGTPTHAARQLPSGEEASRQPAVGSRQ